MCDLDTGEEQEVVVKVTPKDGDDGTKGMECPPDKRSAPWTVKGRSPTGVLIRPRAFTHQTRSYMITRHPMNGGAACPPPEEQTCLPPVCFSAESKDSRFGPTLLGFRPIHRFPTGHPALSSATHCGGNTAFPLPGQSIPTSDCNVANGGALSFTLLMALSKSGLDVTGTSGFSLCWMTREHVLWYA